MPKQVKEFLQRCVVTAVAVLIAAHMIRGIHYDNWQGLFLAIVVLVLLNAFIRPVLMFLSLPFVLLTLGLFVPIINAVLLYVVGRLKYFHVDSFGAAFWGGLVISIISLVLNSLTGTGNARVTVQRGKRPSPPSKSDTGSGPVIDV